MTYLLILSPRLSCVRSSCMRGDSQLPRQTMRWKAASSLRLRLQLRRQIAAVGMSPAAAEDLLGRKPDFPGFFLARAWPWAWHRRRRLSQSQTSHVQGTQRRCSQTPLTGGVRAGSGSVEWQLRPAAGLTRSHARRFFGQSLVRSMLSSWPLLMRRSQMRDVAMNVCSRSSLCATVAAPCYVLYYPCDGGVL
jgi:hypothetical protein